MYAHINLSCVYLVSTLETRQLVIVVNYVYVCIYACVQVGKGGKGNYSLVFRLSALRRGRAINFIHGIKVYMN